MIGKIKETIFRIVRIIQKFYYLKKAEFQAKKNGGRIIYNQLPNLACQLRCDGSGKVSIGDGVCLGYRKAPKIGNGEILLQARTEESVITIGSYCSTSNNLSVISCKKISIGSKCLIGDYVAIYDCDFHDVSPENRYSSPGKSLPVTIGNNVWLGSRVMVLKGVVIGDDSVIGAGSVVTKSIPNRSIAIGVPAKVVKGI